MRRLASALTSLIIGAFLFASLNTPVRATGLWQGRNNFSIRSNPPLNVALNEWARITGFAILTPSTAEAEVPAPLLEGSYTAEKALRILLTDSGLGYCFVNSTTVAVVSKYLLNSSSTNCNSKFSDFTGSPGSVRPAPTGPKFQGGDTDLTRGDQIIPQLVVTGSRSINADIDDTQPYIVFDKKDLMRSGATDLNGFFKARLSMSSGIDSALRADGFLGNSSRLSFRGLESNETLILVDGRHRPSFQSGGASEQPDIAGIPLFLIERIEILPTTASGIYGGAATGGVANIILKRTYSGVTTNLSYGDTFHGGGRTRSFGSSGGYTFRDSDTSLTFGLSYSDTAPLLLQDRPYLLERMRRSDTTGEPPLGSTTNVQSLMGAPLVLKNGTSLGSSITSVPLGYAGVATDGGAALLSSAGKFNLDMADTAQPNGGKNAALMNAPTTLFGMLGLQHRFTDEVSAFVDMNYEGNRGHFLTNRMVTTFDIPADAATNPFQQAVRVTTPGLGGNRNLDVNIATSQVAAGIQFKPDDRFQLGLEHTYSENTYEASAPGGLSPAAADAIASGKFNVMLDTAAFGADFSPWQEQVAEFTKSKTTLHDAKATATFTPYLDARKLLTVTSYIERREEKFSPQEFKSTPSTSRTPERSQSINSVYLGMSSQPIDVDSNIPGIRLLKLSMSGRYDQYVAHGGDSIGDTDTQTTNRLSAFTPTFMAGLSPGRDLLLRASFSQGFLPPEIDQISPSYSLVFPGQIFGLTDPARGNEPLGLLQFFSGGNPDLRAERSKSFSAGVVYQHPYTGVRTSLDWTRITETNDVESLSLSQSVLNGWRSLPEGVVRRGPRSSGDAYDVGPIIGFNSVPGNFGRREIDALDLSIDASTDAIFGGSLDLSLKGTRQLRSRSQLGATGPWVEYVGLVSLPEWKAFANVTWSWRNFEASWSTRAVDHYWLDASHQIDPVLGKRTVPNQVYHDLTLRWTDLSFGGVARDAAIQFGVTNLFNAAPPPDSTALVAGYQYSPHGDARGAAWSLGFQFHY